MEGLTEPAEGSVPHEEPDVNVGSDDSATAPLVADLDWAWDWAKKTGTEPRLPGSIFGKE